jgi:amidohydrolase
MRSLLIVAAISAVSAIPALSPAQTTDPAFRADLERRITEVMPHVIAWRRDIHQHPELSGQETRTSALVAAHLRSLGLEVRTDVGGHGVIGVLRGGRPGPVVALRADMDALPVTEQGDLPFKSTVRTTYNGQDVGVMHACGHDTHTAMLMGVAEVLTGMKARIPGTVKFIFQPAEEGTPAGGAEPMIEAGALENPKVDAIFGLHVTPGPSGVVRYRAGPLMASADNFRIIVHGKQTHGAVPWAGIDPIVVGSQIVLGLQTVVSRQLEISKAPVIVTVGAFNGGVRNNIIPDSAVMIGTLRSFDEGVRREAQARIRKTAEGIAQASGATADVQIETGYPVTINDERLTNRMLATLQRMAGAENVEETLPWTASEDFSKFEQKVPGEFVFLGVTPRTKDWHTAAANHSPLFEADEAAFPVGMRVMAGLALDYLSGAPARP